MQYADSLIDLIGKTPLLKLGRLFPNEDRKSVV